ncbi:endonuclease/exonuclease/phosphatase family protein, putative [Hepatocystis sp. ex Piliocolobus tephrosceles]|nr:endonuclease/exonuclease/phosphatase family protein, putative [Hepatocystis sp. ex Piliocolobus tephrosceles]
MKEKKLKKTLTNEKKNDADLTNNNKDKEKKKSSTNNTYDYNDINKDVVNQNEAKKKQSSNKDSKTNEFKIESKVRNNKNNTTNTNNDNHMYVVDVKIRSISEPINSIKMIDFDERKDNIEKKKKNSNNNINTNKDINYSYERASGKIRERIKENNKIYAEPKLFYNYKTLSTSKNINKRRSNNSGNKISSNNKNNYKNNSINNNNSISFNKIKTSLDSNIGNAEDNINILNDQIKNLQIQNEYKNEDKNEDKNDVNNNKRKTVLGYDHFTYRQQKLNVDDINIIKNFPLNIFVGTWNCEYIDFNKDDRHKKRHTTNNLNEKSVNAMSNLKYKELCLSRSMSPMPNSHYNTYTDTNTYTNTGPFSDDHNLIYSNPLHNKMHSTCSNFKRNTQTRSNLLTVNDNINLNSNTSCDILPYTDNESNKSFNKNVTFNLHNNEQKKVEEQTYDKQVSETYDLKSVYENSNENQKKDIYLSKENEPTYINTQNYTDKKSNYKINVVHNEDKNVETKHIYRHNEKRYTSDLHIKHVSNENKELNTINIKRYNSLNNKSIEQHTFSHWIRPYQDIYVICLQECTSDSIFENISTFLKEVNQETYDFLPLADYKLSGYGDGALLQMKSTIISIWIRKSRLHPRGPVKLCASKAIAFNKLNNSKGCVSILLNIFNQFVLFIGCHMPAKDEQLRQKSREFILNKLSYYYSNKRTTNFKHVFHHVIWAGDFNFRVSGIEMNEIIKHLQKNNLKELLKYDEANKEISNDIKITFKEQPITFLPTYKKNENRPVINKNDFNWVNKEYKLVHNIKWYKGGKQESRNPSVSFYIHKPHGYIYISIWFV